MEPQKALDQSEFHPNRVKDVGEKKGDVQHRLEELSHQINRMSESSQNLIYRIEPVMKRLPEEQIGDECRDTESEMSEIEEMIDDLNHDVELITSRINFALDKLSL